MKKTTFTIIFLLVIAFNAFSSAVITGKFINAKSRLVTLDYAGSYSIISPNYYGKKQLSTFLSLENEFKIIVETSKDYCVYNLGRFEILVRDNDSINIYVDFKDIDKTFIASGENCGLTNFWFAIEMFKPRYRPKVNDKKIMEYWEKQKQCYSDILKAFKLGAFAKSDSISNDKANNINRLIKGSRLSSLEYNLAQNRINYSCISSIMLCTPFEYLKSNINQYVQLFKNINLSRNTIENDYITESLVDNFILLSCLKKELVLNDTITEEEYYQYYLDNNIDIAKDIIRGNLLQKFIANNLFNILIDGEYEKYIELFSKNKYILTTAVFTSKLDDFYSHYLSSLQNKEFNLNSSDKTLNDSTVKVLLNSLKGQKVYLILWKIGDGASYALTPFCELANLDIIQKSVQEQKIKFIDICLGDISTKQHWASMIINHQWKGEHYLYSNGDKKDFRRMFNFEDKMQFCNAELYYLLDTNGNIIKETDGVLIEDLE
jgi:hypothetical protein